MKKRIIPILTFSLTLLLFLIASPADASAKEEDDPKTIVVFGDSISAGYALEDFDYYDPYKAAQSFPNLWAVKYGLVPRENYFNFSHVGDPSADIMKVIKKTDPEIIKKADIIMMSIGGDDAIDGYSNLLLDVMRNDELLHEGLLDGIDLNDSDKLEQEILTSLIDPSKSELMQKLMEKTTDERSNAVYKDIPIRYKANLTEIISYIRGFNPETEIVILAPYNPLESMIFSNPFFSNPLMTSFNRCINEIDRAAASLTNDGRYNHKLTVINMLDSFSGKYTTLTNLTRLDIHPSPQGHEYIMSLIEQSLFREKTVKSAESSSISEASQSGPEEGSKPEAQKSTNQKADGSVLPEYVSYILMSAAILCAALIVFGFVIRHHKEKIRVKKT